MNQPTRNHAKRICKMKHMAEEPSPDPAISHEVQVDLALLLECLKFQTGESSYQKQALGTIADICAHNVTCLKAGLVLPKQCHDEDCIWEFAFVLPAAVREGICNLFRMLSKMRFNVLLMLAVAACEYMCESGGLKFLMEMSCSLCCLEVKETIMYTLGVLAESSVLCQQVLCRSELLTHCSSLLLARTTAPTRLRCSSAYLLLSLFSNNRAGQTLANSSNCLNTLLAVYREGISCLVGGGGGGGGGGDGSDRDRHSVIAPQLWTTVASILAASANNPQNEINQRACASALPATVDLLHSTMVSGVLRTLCTFLCAIISNNKQCQTTLVRAGGLEALAQLLAQLSDVAQSDGKAAQLAIYVAQTLDNCISLNASLAKQLSRYGVVPNLLHLLRVCNPDPANKLSLLLTIGHCTESCEQSQRQLLEAGGIGVLLTLMAEAEGDDDVSHATLFAIHSSARLASTFLELCPGVNTHQHLQEDKPQKKHQPQFNQQQTKGRMHLDCNTEATTRNIERKACLKSWECESQKIQMDVKCCARRQPTSAVPGSVNLAKPKFKISGRRAMYFPKAYSSVSINTRWKKVSRKPETSWLRMSRDKIDVDPVHICREEIKQEIARHKRQLSVCYSSTRCLACSVNGLLLNSLNFVSTLMNCNSTCDLHRELLQIEQAFCRKIAARHVSHPLDNQGRTSSFMKEINAHISKP